MKKFLKYSKLGIGSLVIASALVACSDDDDEFAYTTPYTVNTSNLKKAGTAVDLGLSVKWADMNVGAASESDNGILFAWGDITGTKIEEGSYSIMLEPTALSDLFAKYKGDEKSEIKFDTLAINYTIKYADLKEKVINTAVLVADSVGKDSLTKATMDVAKMEAIKNFLAEKAAYVSKNFKYEGVLEARLVSNIEDKEIEEKFDLTYNLDGTKGSYRMPEKKNAVDSIAYFKKFDDSFEITFYAITSSEKKFFEANQAPKYTDVKDHYGVVAYKTFDGAEYNDIPVYDLKKGNAGCDAATANWGSDWRIPTNEEINELLTKCEWEFLGNGYKVTGPSGNSIFLPAAGCRYDNKVIGTGVAGYYASLGAANGTYTYPSTTDQLAGSEGGITAENTKNYMIFQHGQFEVSKGLYSNITTNYGASIRPVCVK